MRQPLLGDLGLRDLVDHLAEGLPATGLLADPRAHEDDAEDDRQQGTEHQVDDGLGDREVERAEVDRHQFFLLELRRRVELTARERVRRQEQRDRAQREEKALHEETAFPASGPV